MKSRSVVVLAVLAVAALTAFACGSPSGPSNAGNFRLMITDSPYSDAKAVLVTFSEVTIHRSESETAGWETLSFAGGASSRTCDLKRLETAQDILGVGSLAEGSYTQVRLTISSAALYFDGPSTGGPCGAVAPAGAFETLEIPSGIVRLNRPFTVPESGVTTMLIDFDGDRSIHDMGNGQHRMTPVIAVVSVGGP
jgi:hypothetical protein